MKNYLFLCIFLFFGFLRAEEFTVGTTSGYAPFVSLDNNGNYVGFDIDLAKLIAGKLNKKLVIKDLGSMPSLMMGLKQKKIDAIIWAISITEERQKQMEMIYYQGDKITTMPIFFWGKIPENIQSLEDLKNVCVEAGTYQEQVMRNYPNLTLKNVDKITDAICELKFGKSIAAAVDNSLVAFLQKQNPELKALYFPLPLNQQSLGNGICIHKNNADLSAQVRKAVEELSKEGKIEELEKKWFQ